jgi:hypothetical protein
MDMEGDFNLRDISSLHGSLESLTRYIKWARPLFFALQNAIRLELMRRYHTLKRWYGNSSRTNLPLRYCADLIRSSLVTKPKSCGLVVT